jgi:hypothetical protein
VSYVAELERVLADDGDRPMRLSDLAVAVRAVAEIASLIEQHHAKLVETVQFVNALQDRLLLVEELPASAPMGALIRLTKGTVAARQPVYVGNGPNQPLTKLLPVAL